MFTKGLTSGEAKKLFVQYGPNELSQVKKISALVSFLVTFKNPLIFILLFAAIISGFVGDYVSAFIIIAIVLVSVVLDFLNTYRSQKAADALKARVTTTTHVYRDQKLITIPASAIVPGDVIELGAGDIIPADGVIVAAKDFFLNESSLNGESFPVEKILQAPAYLGTNVVTGTGTMLVQFTGKKTKFSSIADSLSEHNPITEFDRSIRDFSTLIMKITFILVIVIFFINAYFKHNILESFLFSAALAVGLTPELLPAIIAVNLSKGSLAMSRHGVIVKKLTSIQNFGSMDILCTDKTGTLTEDNIVLVKYVDALGKEDEDIFQYAYISSTFRSGFQNPLDGAIKDFKTINIGHLTKTDEIPFDYERKRDSVVISGAQGIMLVTKGAPEELFKVCSFYKNEKESLTSDILLNLQKEYESLSKDGFRVLGVAYKTLQQQNQRYEKDVEHDLVFVGFIAFLDPPKKSATDTLKMLEQYGITIKIITGDNELVTQKVAREIQLPIQGIVMGHDMDAMSDVKLSLVVEKTTIFARVTPEQKKRIIQALQRNGHVVGYMGDGINDAPSLKAADVGISVNNAVDVAKESADLILLNKSLSDLVNGVIEGRKTFANTLKYLMMALSSNFGNMFSMAAASLYFPFLPMLPTQILLNNLLYDASQFAIPLDNVDVQDLQKPRKLNIKFIKHFMYVFGPLSSVFDLMTFLVLYFIFHLHHGGFQTGWFLESLTTQALVIFLIRTRYFTKKHTKPGKYLIFATIAAIIIGWYLALGNFGHFFMFTSLPLWTIASLVGITALYLITVEWAKRMFYKKYSQ